MSAELISDLKTLILPETLKTVQMVFFSSLYSIIIGTILGIVLFITKDDGLRPNKFFSFIIGIIVNIGRSVPFVILIIALIPVTKLIVGRILGVNAAIVYLTIAAIPFVARIMESSFSEIDTGLIEASKAMGASDFQIVIKVVIMESLQSIISNMTITIINIIGYSAMAGMIGAGGLGDVAIKYGFQQFRNDITIVVVVVLVLLVQIIQTIGNLLSKKIVFIIHRFKKYD